MSDILFIQIRNFEKIYTPYEYTGDDDNIDDFENELQFFQNKDSISTHDASTAIMHLHSYLDDLVSDDSYEDKYHHSHIELLQLVGLENPETKLAKKAYGGEDVLQNPTNHGTPPLTGIFGLWVTSRANYFRKDDRVVINPGGSTEEEHDVVGYIENTIYISTQLLANHPVGTVVRKTSPNTLSDVKIYNFLNEIDLDAEFGGFSYGLFISNVNTSLLGLLLWLESYISSKGNISITYIVYEGGEYRIRNTPPKKIVKVFRIVL